MNKSNINEQSAGTAVDNDSSAQNHSVSQPNANTNVVGSLFKSREIKFRAWLIPDDDFESDLPYMTYDLAFEDYAPVNEQLKSVSTLMQYAGLKDKNGKEIYEGDIIKTSLSFRSYEFTPPYHPTGHDGYGEIDCIGTIQFKDGCFVFYCTKVIKETNVWHDEYNLTKHFINKYHSLRNVSEVLGNVFENPELSQTLR